MRQLLSSAEDMFHYYNLDDTDHDSINKFLSSLVERALVELEASSCIGIGDDGSSIEALTLGRISSYYYLNHLTVRMFQDNLTPNSTLEELLTMLSDAHEYAELPVRHNEDQINSELAPRLPLAVNPHSYDSAHTKAHLLFQAHFSQSTLPSTDYLTDTKSVLDQAIRILQAMLDATADQGNLIPALHVINLVQMVVQGRWAHESSLLILPHIHSYNLHCIRYVGDKTGKKRTAIESLPELMAYAEDRFELLLEMLEGEIERKEISQVYTVLQQLPVIDVKMTVRGWWEGETGQVEKMVPMSHKGGSRPDKDWIPVHADQEYVLNVELRRANKVKKHDSKAYTSRFPKPKDEGWFLVIGEVDKKELIALKRVGYVRNRTNVQLALYTPEIPGRVIYTLYLMSDAYLGLDQQYDICLDVVPASIEAQVNTELKEELEGLDF
ncbi:activating signal cointegrator 1 complex subunit 3-like isoform X1 [Lingula anatina]|uniref:Activating signal cointegrator 1 complex subunit 3-like isoform X1 n=2 Tax=Lingula anatina TaxID=7574 RepID=A0A1S3KAN2_LINAN|nr:activating signal cointegrator 1 complex subunit 3-like isoform X1 [Lingula anatina]|eukprot:XP_013419499.1 activating signal cointegrator 1 complex subunit 3-like isoform X1 [Lingula anatina]